MPILFETSWEVCNKVGGIYTVLSTKARELKKLYGDRLVFIGPDVWTNENKPPDFIERKTFMHRSLANVDFPDGITVRTGRWDIPGSPVVVLVGFQHLIGKIDEFYGEAWRCYGVDSLHGYGDYDEGCAFAVAAAKVIKRLTSLLGEEDSEVIAHFNEWTTGMGLLWLQRNMPGASTVFTTHATSIGRSISGNGKPLYEYFTAYNGDQMAFELNMQAKHSLEKAAAHAADCFTTVSEITARECAQLLDIRPQVVTPNGFEPDFVPSSKESDYNRKRGRKKLLDILRALRGREFPDDTLLVATSGRNEYRNKGLDIFLDSIARTGMKSPDRPIAAFVLVPAWVKEPDSKLELSMQAGVHGNADPDYLTHRLFNEQDDSVACRIRHLEYEGKLNSTPVVYIPCYLDGNDGIVNLTYYDLLPAFDLTVFASYYEPWGYTPLESVAFGVPTITTDKSGFGQWILDTAQTDLVESGVAVVKRGDTNYNETVDRISDIISQYRQLPAQMQVKARVAGKKTARRADWKFFIKDYEQAFRIAQEHRSERLRKASGEIN